VGWPDGVAACETSFTICTTEYNVQASQEAGYDARTRFEIGRKEFKIKRLL
jgi:hypothetical protein